jgi:hypothetical protein
MAENIYLILYAFQTPVIALNAANAQLCVGI